MNEVDHADLVRQQFEAEIAELATHAGSTGQESFALSLMRQQAADRISALRAELEGLGSDHFELAFAEHSAADTHSMSTTLLANLLSRFQRALTYAGWARLAGPGVHGRPPSLVARAFETEVNALARGSFAIDLSPHEVALENLALEGAIQDFLKLAAAGAHADQPEPARELVDVAQELGAEATRRFALFFAKVHDARLEARFEWSDRPEDQVVLAPSQAEKLSEWLNAVEQEFETEAITGRLTAADANEGRFAITDERGEIHEGRAAPELLSQAVIDADYVAHLRVTKYVSTLTGAERKRLVLESLSALDG